MVAGTGAGVRGGDGVVVIMDDNHHNGGGGKDGMIPLLEMEIMTPPQLRQTC